MKGTIVTSLLKSYMKEISEENISLFLSCIDLKEYPKDYVLIKEKTIAKDFFIVVSGIVGSYSKSKANDKEYIRALHNKGTIFTNISSLDKDNNSINYYKSLSSCTVFKGSYLDFIKLTTENHQLSLLYNRIIEHSLLQSQKRIDELSFMDATERYKSLKNRFANIENLVPQYQIASYLNITPVQLSRIRKKMYSV